MIIEDECDFDDNGVVIGIALSENKKCKQDCLKSG